MAQDNRGVEISVQADIREVERYLNRVQKRIVPNVASQSLNRARQRVQTMVIKALAKRTKVKQKIIRNRVKFKAAKPKLLITEIHGWWSGVPMIRLGQARETKRGVRVAGRLVDDGFIVRSRWGHHEVLKRSTNSRLPVPRQTVAIETDGDRLTRVFVKRKGGALFVKEFERQLARKLR